METILIFGKGYVAGHIERAYSARGHRVVVSDLRVQDYSDLFEEIARVAPTVVVNALGKTGKPNVDWCEDHKMETLQSNVVAPLLIAQACEALKVYMVHIGSGCVYEGYGEHGQGFEEVDEPNFAGSFYSKTKAWSETMLAEFPVLQLRLRMPLDEMPGERNFITKITRYPKVISVPNSISVMADFLKAFEVLVERRVTGIFNATNPGTITHQEILDLYCELVDPTYRYALFSVEEMEKLTKARRSNCGLSSAKLEAHGVFLRPVHQAVRETLEAYARNLKRH